jgi:hypothetical protein
LIRGNAIFLNKVLLRIHSHQSDFSGGLPSSSRSLRCFIWDYYHFAGDEQFKHLAILRGIILFQVIPLGPSDRVRVIHGATALFFLTGAIAMRSSDCTELSRMKNR